MAYYRKPLQRREVTIIRRMKKVLKMPVTQIAIAVERHKSSIYKALDPAWRETPRGRPQKLTKKDITNLVKELRAMQRQARARREITLAMLKKQAKCKACSKVTGKALSTRGIRFRRMRSKPILTKDDVKVRYAFAKKWRHKSREWWVKKIFSIDLKNFPCYVHAQARDVAAMREVRGAYREAGQGLDECFVVVPKHLRYNPGVKSAKVAAGVGGGRVRMWRVLGKKWSGRAAADLYKGPVVEALQRMGGKRKFQVLEDNDPTGFKSNAGKRAKREEGIKVFEIPKRSPDLNVCDYALWKMVDKKMLRQERRWPRSKRETRAQYLDRLRAAAQGLSPAAVNAAVGDMQRRCQRLYAKKGGLFEEGGQRSGSVR